MVAGSTMSAARAVAVMKCSGRRRKTGHPGKAALDPIMIRRDRKGIVFG